MNGFIIVKDLETAVSRGFYRKDLSEVDVLLVVRPGSHVHDVADLLTKMLDEAFQGEFDPIPKDN